MNIGTSYFWKIGNRKIGDKAISISRGNPRVKVLGTIIELAPTWEMINLKNEDEYIKQFKDKLDKLDPNSIYEEIKEISNGREEVYLCCFENSFDFCHRHIVAEWLEENLGITIQELDQENKKRINYRYIK